MIKLRVVRKGRTKKKPALLSPGAHTRTVISGWKNRDAIQRFRWTKFWWIPTTTTTPKKWCIMNLPVFYVVVVSVVLSSGGKWRGKKKRERLRRCSFFLALSGHLNLLVYTGWAPYSRVRDPASTFFHRKKKEIELYIESWIIITYYMQRASERVSKRSVLGRIRDGAVRINVVGVTQTRNYYTRVRGSCMLVSSSTAGHWGPRESLKANRERRGDMAIHV